MTENGQSLVESLEDGKQEMAGPPLLAPAPPSAGRPRQAGAALLAWRDLKEAVEQSWFWFTLGWVDTLQRYRGSILGPFWLTLTTGFFIAGMGPLYAGLFGLDTAQYMPFMALGVLIWNFITATINESCSAFINAGALMKQMRIPRMTIIFHILWRNIIVLAHNIPVGAAVLVYGGVSLSPAMLLAIPGFVLLCLNLLWIGLLLAIVGTRFRDILPIVSSILSLGFFFTPVMWNPSMQRVSPWVINSNPFAAFIEVVRAPLLGMPISAPLLLLALGSLAVGSLATAWMFIKYRKQIIYWV